MRPARSQKGPPREPLASCVACGVLSLALISLWHLLAASWTHTHTEDAGKWQPRSLQEAASSAVTPSPYVDTQLGKVSNVSNQEPPPVLIIYEQYHGVNAWRHLHKISPPYRGLCQSPGHVRPGGRDVDGPALLELLGDKYYQNVMCEYGGFFALAAATELLQASPWLGFQSWRAREKKVSLSAAALAGVTAAVGSRAHGEAMYFWVQRGGGNALEVDSRFFWSCDKWHADNCSSTFRHVFWRLHSTASDGGWLPPMPEDGDSWAYMSYWIMPREQFLAYVSYARMFLVVLDSLLYSVHHDQGYCPLGVGCGYCPKGTPANYLWSHCWCFLLERLVNIWAYHTGLRMVYVDPATGAMAEYHPVDRRSMKHEWFSRAALVQLERGFPGLAASFPHGLHLYKRLGWNVTHPLALAI